MKISKKDRLERETKLLGIKPVVDHFHSEKKGRSTPYPVEVKSAVIEAWDFGINISKISKLLGIKLSTISAWRRFLPKNKPLPESKSHSDKATLRELKIIPGIREIDSNEGMIQIRLPNQVELQIPSQMVGLDLLKGLMALEALCS